MTSKSMRSNPEGESDQQKQRDGMQAQEGCFLSQGLHLENSRRLDVDKPPLLLLAFSALGSVPRWWLPSGSSELVASHSSLLSGGH